MRNLLRKPACWVFLILLGSNAFFWHTRDWNTASRLMLTYSLVDRGTVIITGLEEQTGDKAKFQGQYYSDKLPGFALLAAVPYAGLEAGLRDSFSSASRGGGACRTGRPTTGSRCSRPGF